MQNNKNIKTIEKQFKAIDDKMFQVEKDFEAMKILLNKLDTITEDIRTIEDFYHHEDYQQNMALLEENNKNNYWSGSQDGIWNLGIEYRSLRVQLLKKLMDNVYEDTLKIVD